MPLWAQAEACYLAIPTGLCCPHIHEPDAMVVQVPSGFCTRVVPCVGCTPEGHTGLPDSKVGRSKVPNGRMVKEGADGLAGFIVGMEFWLEVIEYLFELPVHFILCPAAAQQRVRRLHVTLSFRRAAVAHDMSCPKIAVWQNRKLPKNLMLLNWTAWFSKEFQSACEQAHAVQIYKTVLLFVY